MWTGKLLSPTRRRTVVNRMVSILSISPRHAGLLLEQPRSTKRLSPTAPSDFEQTLRARLRELAKARQRYVYR